MLARSRDRHFAARHWFARLNGAILMMVFGAGLAACAVGALVFDMARWIGH